MFNTDGKGKYKYKQMKVTFGGDWEWLARLLGLSGPNGRHFCLHCLCVKPDLTAGKGASYGLHEHGNGECDELESVSDDVAGVNLLRTYEGCNSSHEKFIAEGNDNIADFNNCKEPPLNWDSGAIIDSVSTTPLHINLDLGLQNINIIESMAVKLDEDVKAADGATSASVIGHMERRGHLLEEIQALSDQQQDFQRQIDDINERIEDVKSRNLEHFRKANRVLVDRSREAVESRNQVKVMNRERGTVEQLLKDCIKNTEQTETQLERTLADIEKEKGPFKEKFDEVMNSLKLKRVVYHSGALIGPDVYKTLQPQAIQLFGGIFQPIEIETKAGKQMFSSVEMVEKVTGLLHRFSDCYKLYNKNTPLCRHEVEQLCLNCAEYGAWFPVNFPTESLKPKFHLLTVEVPRQVRRMRTIGMLTEQVSESIHPYINKLERMFASTRHVPDRQRLIMKQHTLLSSM